MSTTTMRCAPIRCGAAVIGELAAKRSDCQALASKGTLNWLELSGREPTYHKIAHDPAAIEELCVDLS